MKKRITIILLILLVTSFSADKSNAGVKKIWPDQLKPEESTTGWYQLPAGVSSVNSSFANYYARVKLPLGKVVKKLTYYYDGSFSPVYTEVKLWRNKFGEVPQTMADCVGNDVTNGPIVVEDNTINFPKIKSGYIYWVRVRTTQNAVVRGVSITYK